MKPFPEINLLESLSDPRMRWQDDPAGWNLVMAALRFPQRDNLQTRAKELVLRKLIYAASTGDPFFPKYPSCGILPSPEGRIRLLALPTGETLSMSVKDTTSHLLICGPTGKGKSVWLRGFLRDALVSGEDVFINVLDRKGTMDICDSRTLLESGFEMNFFKPADIPIAPLQNPDPTKISSQHMANVTVQMLSAAWSLVASTTVLQEVTHVLFREPRPKTWDDLRQRIMAWKPDSRRSIEYKDVLTRQFTAVHYSLGDAICAYESNAVELLTRRSRVCNVIRIDDLPDSVAALYPAMLLYSDYEYRKANPEARKRIGIYCIDDSMGILRRRSTRQDDGESISPLDNLVFMCRVFGISLVVATQNPSATSLFYCQNAGTIVSTGASGEDVKELRSLMNLSEEEASRLCALQRQDGQWAEAVAVSRNVWPHALLGVFPYME